MTDEDELAKLQRKLHSQSKEADVPKDDLAEVRDIALQKVAGFSACLEERAVAISHMNADLSAIECWRNEGVGARWRRAESVGGARLNRVVLSYWTEFDTVPRPAVQSPRPWDFMRKGHYLHVIFFRDRKRIDDQELWFKLPLEQFESAWVMTVQHTRDAVYGQTETSESQTLHTFASDHALADFCLDRLIRIAY